MFLTNFFRVSKSESSVKKCVSGADSSVWETPCWTLFIYCVAMRFYAVFLGYLPLSLLSLTHVPWKWKTGQKGFDSKGRTAAQNCQSPYIRPAVMHYMAHSPHCTVKGTMKWSLLRLGNAHERSIFHHSSLHCKKFQVSLTNTKDIDD